MIRRAEAQPVEERDRPRAHRDDVAQDSADAGRRALERLDRRRVVVRLDLERDRLALAEVDDAGVLARPLQHALAGRRAAASAAARSACSRSAPTRAARRPRARSGSAPGREDPRSARTRRPSARARGAEAVPQPASGGQCIRRPPTVPCRGASAVTPLVRLPDRSLAAIWGASYLFIKVAVRDFPPAAMIEIRLARRRHPARALPRRDAMGWRDALADVARGGLARLRDRRRQRRDPVHAHRLGREAHRLGHRGGRELDGADLQRLARAAGCCRRERTVAPPARRRSARARGCRRAHGRPADASAGGSWRGTAGRRAGLALLRVRRDPRAEEPRERARAHARAASMLGGALALLPLALLDLRPTTRPAGSRSRRSRR